MNRGNAYKLLRKLATRAGRSKLGRFLAEGDTFLLPWLQFRLGVCLEFGFALFTFESPLCLAWL